MITMFECIRRSKHTLGKIKVRKSFSDNPPGPNKLIEKTAEFIAGRKLPPIYVDRDFYLIDGYCTYLIATTLGSDRVKILQIREKRETPDADE